MNGLYFIAVASVIAAAELFVGCSKQASDKPVSTAVDVADAACTLVQAVTDDGTVHAVCATVDEIGQIVDVISRLRSLRPDAGACSNVPTTSVCAHPNQIARGIDEVLKTRELRKDASQ